MRIAVYAFDDITMFHLAAPLMVFGEVGRLGLAPDWQTRLWSDRAGTVRTIEGYPIGEVAGPDTVEWADIIVIPSWPHSLTPVNDELKNAITSAHARGAAIVGLCLGAFALADTGLLGGRSAVTHWEVMPLLAERSIGSKVDSSVLYIDHGDVLTSAGTASAIDACLHRLDIAFLHEPPPADLFQHRVLEEAFGVAIDPSVDVTGDHDDTWPLEALDGLDVLVHSREQVPIGHDQLIAAAHHAGATPRWHFANYTENAHACLRATGSTAAIMVHTSATRLLPEWTWRRLIEPPLTMQTWIVRQPVVRTVVAAVTDTIIGAIDAT